jgi:dipeptidyl aminopeptidase/acylaminoacyl peptidase
MRRYIIYTVVWALAACSAQTPPKEDSAPIGSAEALLPDPAEGVALLPRGALFAQPDREALKLSPDGKWVSFLAPLDGVQGLWLASASEPSKAWPLTGKAEHGVQTYAWAYTSEEILYLPDTPFPEPQPLMRVGLKEGGEPPKSLTPQNAARVQLLQLSPKHPREVLVGINDRDPLWHDAARLDIRTGKLTRVLENPGFVALQADADYQIRVGVKLAPEGGLSYQVPVGKRWAPLLELGLYEAWEAQTFGLDEAQQRLYLLDPRGGGPARLVSLDLKTGEAQTLAQPASPGAALDETLFDPATHKLLGYGWLDGRRRWAFLDPQVEADVGWVSEQHPGNLKVLSRSLDNQTWIVEVEEDRAPPKTFLFQRAKRKLSPLYSGNLALEQATLSHTRELEVTASDGARLRAYVSLPPWVEAGGGPKKPLPTVILLHDPSAQPPAWGWDPWHQWLANRGYAVVTLHARPVPKREHGTRAEELLGRGALGDLTRLLDHLVEAKLSDPKRVGLVGHAAQGSLALRYAAQHPGRLACVVGIEAPLDLGRVAASVEAGWPAPLRQQLLLLYGDPSTEGGRAVMAERSPLTYAPALQTPSLHVSEGFAPTTPSEDIGRWVKSLPATAPHSALRFEAEGDPAEFDGVAATLAVLETFLHGRLSPGERLQGYENDLWGSGLQVFAGGEQLPGLQRALDAQPPSQTEEEEVLP